MTSPPSNDRPPSKLALARYATGELNPEEAKAIEARLTDACRAYLNELEVARTAMPPLDIDALRQRAIPAEGADERVQTLQPANRPMGWLRPVMGLVALAAVMLLVPWTFWPGDDTDTGIRVRGDASLLVFHLVDDTLVPYQGEALAAGASLGFQVQGHLEQLPVLANVDGLGKVALVYPLSGDSSLVAVDSIRALPGTWTLGKQGGQFELFVLAFGEAPETVVKQLREVVSDSGPGAVLDWVETVPTRSVVQVARQ